MEFSCCALAARRNVLSDNEVICLIYSITARNHEVFLPNYCAAGHAAGLNAGHFPLVVMGRRHLHLRTGASVNADKR